MPRLTALLIAAFAACTSSLAQADTTCEALNEADLIGLVLSGQAAVDRGNPDTHRGIVREIRGRIPCLTFAPPPRLLADYFVLEALAAFGDQGDWQGPLGAALRARPGVDRGVGPAHPMARFESEPLPTATRLVPEGVRLYVDGELAVSVPAAGATHLVQVSRDGLWRSEVFKDTPVPEAFLSDPIQAPLSVRVWGHIGVSLGAGGAVQRRGEGWPDSLGQNDTVPDQTWLTLWPAAAGSGGIEYGRLGMQADVDVGLAGVSRPVGSHAQAAATVRLGSVWLGAGAGLGGSAYVLAEGMGDLDDPTYTWSVAPLAYGLAMATVRDERWDAAVSIGAGPAVRRGALRVALHRPLSGTEIPLRLGLSSVVQQGLFEEDRASGKPVSTVTWRAGFELGIGR